MTPHSAMPIIRDLSGDSLAPLCFHPVPLPYPPPRDTFAKILVHRHKSRRQGTPPFPSTAIRLPPRTPAKVPTPLRSAPKPFEDTGAPSNAFERLRASSSSFEPLQAPSNPFGPRRTPSSAVEALRRSRRHFARSRDLTCASRRPHSSRRLPF